MTDPTDPPNDPPVDPPVAPPLDPTMESRMAAIEAAVGTVNGDIGSIKEAIEAALKPPEVPADPPVDPATLDPEVVKLQGQVNLLTTAMEQDAAQKLAISTERKTEIIDAIVANNPAYAVQRESLTSMEESFLNMLAEQSKPAEPRTRAAGGTKYGSESIQSQAIRLREERRKNMIR